MHRFWQLPGPHGFVSSISDDIRSGRNVCILLPMVAPTGLRHSLEEELDGFLEWRRIEAECVTSPIDSLAKRFGGNDNPGAVWDMPYLMSLSGFQGLVLWLEGVPSPSWPAWREFLHEYAHHCRNVDSLDRTIFVVVLKGELTGDPPKGDPSLAVRPWCDQVGSLDALLFSTQLLQRDDDRPATVHALLATTIARVAGGCPRTIQHLAGLSPSEILQPEPSLERLGVDLGFHPTSESVWSDGSLMQLDGRPFPHAAWAAVSGRTDEIERRCWAAQASVLMGLIEEQRQTLLPLARRYLRLHIRNGEDVVHDVAELEIGSLWHHLRQAGISTNALRRITVLRDVRNALAHLEALDPDLALHPLLHEIDVTGGER